MDLGNKKQQQRAPSTTEDQEEEKYAMDDEGPAFLKDGKDLSGI